MTGPSYEAVCQQVFEHAGQAMLFADRGGVVRFWNQSAQDVFGYAASEAVGQTLDILIPAPWRERHWEGYRQAMVAGTTRYARNVLAVPALRKDGTRVSIEFTIVLVRGADETVLGAAAVIQDVTERWRRERAMKDRIASLQARLDRATPLTAVDQVDGAKSLPVG
jgi:PAS domain S-box-containing protein